MNDSEVKETPVPVSIRMTNTTSNRFKTISEKNSVSQEKMLILLMNEHERNEVKKKLPDRQGELETFDELADTMKRMFLSVLEQNRNIKTVVRSEFEEQMKAKDTLLQEQLKKSQEAIKQAEKALNSEKSALSKMESLNNSFVELQKKYDKDIEMATRRSDDLTLLAASLKNNVEEQKEQIKSQNASLEELKDKLEKTNSMLTSCHKESEEIKQKNSKLEMVNAQQLVTIENLTAELEKCKEDQKRHEEKTIEQAEFQKEKALLEKEKAFQHTLEQLNTRHKEELNTYNDRYMKLLESINTLHGQE